MEQISKVFIFLIVLLECQNVSGLTASEVATLKKSVRVMIEKTSVIQGAAKSRPFLGGLARIGFHDCIGERCDGCINMDMDKNAGLERYIDTIEIYYQKHASHLISRADYWALASGEAITFAAELNMCKECDNDEVNILFKYGREDCDGGPYTTDTHTFPTAAMGGDEVVRFFANQFNFTAEQSAAIMGAHTLGEAHPSASGYTAKWVERNNRFDNAYFKDMLSKEKNWQLKNVTTPRGMKWQWEDSTGSVMMLNADMGLPLDIQRHISQETGKTTCPKSGCGNNMVTRDYIVNFARNNTLWIKTFTEAFQSMISHGYDSLSLPTD